MTIATAKVIADSFAEESGVRLVTMQLRYPRFIHAEAKTHRVITNGSNCYEVLTDSISFMDDPMLSRNASSSRAIPVAKMIEQVRTDPAMPAHWGKNQPGMQAREEIQHVGAAMDQWRRAARNAADVAEEMNSLGLHKQVVNRILEPFQFIHVIVSATEWKNFFDLRCHPDADPTMQALAYAMRDAMTASIPTKRKGGFQDIEAWHLPYISLEERMTWRDNPAHLAKLSVARCARVSYLTHDGHVPHPEADLALYDRLVGSEPRHASPTEHQACALAHSSEWSNNFRGWYQFRAVISDCTLRVR